MIPNFRAFIKFKGAVNPVQPVSNIDFENEMVKIEQGLAFKFDDVILMQTTGLKDENGNEIYDGDIISMRWTIYDEPNLSHIRSRAGYAPRIDSGNQSTELWLRHDDCQIVGNIWENPVMLEVD